MSSAYGIHMDKEEARKALGERVRKLRKEQNLTLRKFGLMIGLSKDYIVDIEFGRKSPTLDTIIKIASGLDITPAELLEGIGEPDVKRKRKPVQDERPHRRYHSAPF